MPAAKAPVEVSVRIAAPPERVHALVADLSRMSEWSPETTGIEWLDGASGPALGARFRGTNRNGRRAWSTTCTIVVLEPPREITWQVRANGFSISRWTYRSEPDGEGGTVLTERTEDERPALLRLVAPAATGVSDRAEHNRRTMAETLARIKAAAESSA